MTDRTFTEAEEAEISSIVEHVRVSRSEAEASVARAENEQGVEAAFAKSPAENPDSAGVADLPFSPKLTAEHRKRNDEIIAEFEQRHSEDGGQDANAEFAQMLAALIGGIAVAGEGDMPPFPVDSDDDDDEGDLD